MNALDGQGAGGIEARPVLARAFHLVPDARLRPTLSAEVLGLQARRARDQEDALEIVLVAADPVLALWQFLPPGLLLAGVIGEHALPPALSASSPPVPVVAGVTDALETIADGDLVILDAARGRVLLRPDALDVARLQTALARARPRVLLGAAHLPARLQNGRMVEVWARAVSDSDVDALGNCGADGVFLPDPHGLFPSPEGAFDPGDALLTGLRQVVQAIGGGALCVGESPAASPLPPRVLVQIAAECRLRLAVEPFAGSVEELTFALSDAAQAEEAGGSAVALPRLAAWLSLPPEDGDEISALFEETLWSAPEVPPSFAFVPPLVRVLLPPGDSDPWLDALENAVRAGASGVVVPPARVVPAKDFIRSLDY